jgi:flagellin-like protein
MGGRFYRRGMSPLIATVLLMAFAVALGGMIMNWSIDASSNSGDCENIKIHVSQLCAKDDKIFLTLRNDKESAELRGIKLNLIESSIESTLSIKDSALAPGQPLDISIPAATAFDTRVDILAVVGSEENPYTCTDPKERAAPIRQC